MDNAERTPAAGAPLARRRLRLAAALAITIAAAAAPAHAQVAGSACGGLANAYGPYDYRTDRSKLEIVESHHFTPQVEMLIKGQEGYVGSDIDYTLRAFPNHHRALLAMMRYGEKLKLERVGGANYNVECYFIRATSFRPNDTTVRMLYATYLNGRQQRAQALQQLALAVSYASDSALTHYNIGLVYTDLGEWDKALEQAHEAMRLGFDRSDLKDRLVAAQKWAEPASAPR